MFLRIRDRFCAVLFFSTHLVDAQQQSNNFEERHRNEQHGSRCPRVSERRLWDDLSCEEQNAFLRNIRRLKRNGTYDTFVRVHIENERAVHGTPEFLPWHRWFIYQFELALRSVADPPYRCMSLPYWDWELDSGNEGASSVFALETFSSFEGTNENGRCQFQINHGRGTGSCLRRTLNFDFPFWGEARVAALIRRYSQYGDDFSSDRTRNNGFRAALEGGPHAATHNFIGGSMIDESAPNDPLFWIHHANVDRLWSLFQDYHGHTTTPFRSYNVPTHYEGVNLDFPMPFGGTKSWDFRIRNLRPPTPREVLSNNGYILNVRYIHHNPLPSEPGYTTDRQWFGTPPTLIDRCRRRSRINNPRRQLQIKSRASNEEDVASSSRTESKEHDKSTYLRGIGGYRNTKGKISTILPSHYAGSDVDINEESTSVKKCLRSNNFRGLQDRERWDELCRKIPRNHITYGEQLDELAIEKCNELGNPRSAVNDWIQRMGMSNEIVAFDCYHVADENELHSI